MTWLDENDTYDKDRSTCKCQACGDTTQEGDELCASCEFMYDKERNKD